jgi:hypothetical protein
MRGARLNEYGTLMAGSTVQGKSLHWLTTAFACSLQSGQRVGRPRRATSAPPFAQAVRRAVHSNPLIATNAWQRCSSSPASCRKRAAQMDAAALGQFSHRAAGGNPWAAAQAEGCGVQRGVLEHGGMAPAGGADGSLGNMRLPTPWSAGVDDGGGRLSPGCGAAEASRAAAGWPRFAAAPSAAETQLAAMLACWENPCVRPPAEKCLLDVAALTEGCAQRMVPRFLTREHLGGARVLNQVCAFRTEAPPAPSLRRQTQSMGLGNNFFPCKKAYSHDRKVQKTS